MLAGRQLVHFHPTHKFLCQRTQVALAATQWRREQPASRSEDHLDRQVRHQRVLRSVCAGFVNDLAEFVDQAVALVQATPSGRHRLVAKKTRAVGEFF